MLNEMPHEALLSSILGLTLVLLGVLALWAVFPLHRCADDEQRQKRAIRSHRTAGWTFVAVFLWMLVSMIRRLMGYNEEFAPRINLHIALALAICSLLAIKIAIVRSVPGLRKALVALGLGTFVLAFVMVGITGGYYFQRRISGTPYVSHASLGAAFDDDALAKEYLIAKCSTCHLLEEILAQRRSAKEWELLVNRMIQIAQPRITTAEGSLIIGYLAKNHVPRPIQAHEGMTDLERHCLHCHGEEQIFAVPRDLEGWKKIVRRMSLLDPQRVPREEVDAIAEGLAARQPR